MPALIFDYDGLIADTEELFASVLVEHLAVRGVTTDFAAMAPFFGSTGPDNDAAWDRQLRLWLGADADTSGFESVVWEYAEARRHAVPLRAGVTELLDAAERAGWQVAIGTGQRRERLDHHLEHLGLRGRFDVIVTASEVARGKPAPDVFLEVARRLGREPSECVVFEDSLPGYEAALAAGMSVVICPCAVTLHTTFPAEARVVTTLHEIRLDELAVR